MNLWYCLPARWRSVVIVLLASSCLASTTVPLRAETSAAERLRSLDTSLNLIPEDAAFYSSTLHGRQQIEAIAHSRAWAKLQKMPAVQMARTMMELQLAMPGSKAAEAKKYLKSPLAQRFLGLLADMFSNDVFVYADADAVDSLQLMQEVAAAVRYGPPLLQISGQAEGINPNQLKSMLTIAALAENVDRLKAPGIVVGFKVENKARAFEHLGKLEAILTLALASKDPKLAEAVAHAEVSGTDYLVVTLRGNMIPWDEVPLDKFKELELQEGSVDKLVEKVKTEKLVIAFGIRGDYLLLSIGSSTEPLAKLGQGVGLAGRPEMAPLAKYADRQLVSIDYVSKEFMEAANANQRKIDDAVDFLEQIAPSLKLSEDEQSKILDDAKELAKHIRQRMPVVGAVSQATFVTEQGIESFRYDWTTHPGLDGGKSLGLLGHVGGSPILAMVLRGRVSVDEYDLAVNWLAKGYSYFREYGLPHMPADERQQFEKVAEAAEPILKQFNKINREKFLPALDGQLGLVIDDQLTSKQFLSTKPATKHAMPMAEPAILLGVRDSKLMRDALSDYWDAIHDAWDAAGEFNPKLADVELPEPKTVDVDNGEIFVFTPPEECPVDKQITPSVGLNKHVCVFSLSQAHAARLLKTTPLDAGGVLASTNRPLAAAAVFDWAGLLRAGRPWIEMAVDKVIEEKFAQVVPEEQADAIKAQVRTVIELLSVVRCVTSEAYPDGRAMVTHTLTEIRDVD